MRTDRTISPGDQIEEWADIVVVGGGGAGLAAASEAAAAGARVVLLEKNGALGGSTAWSVGSISATRTAHQRARGIEDSPEAHFEDLELLAGRHANRDNRELRRILVDETPTTFEWLESLGLVFVGPNEEPPHRVPRMHNVLPNSRAFPHALGRHCRRLGVEIRCDARAEHLIEREGRILGVAYRRAGAPATIGARRGVVLAAGDYSAGTEMKERFAAPEVAALEPVNPTATGDGFALALSHGAELVNGDIVRGPVMRFVPPPGGGLIRRLPPSRALGTVMRWGFERLPERVVRPFAMAFLTTALGPAVELFREGAILVDREGQRFTEELDRPGYAVPHRPGGLAYIVMDGAVAAKFSAWPSYVSTAPGVAYAYLDDYRRNRRDIFHEAADPAALARSIGADPAVFAATLQAYNAEARARGAGGPRPPLERPPFVALGPVRSYVVFTDGGLRVDTSLRVLAAGVPIPGLYAAGSNGQGGLLLEGHGHHLAWAFVSGRIAGRNAAANDPLAADKQGVAGHG